MNNKTRIHDGVAGALVTLGVILGYWINPLWLLLPGILGIVLVQSAFTGFCPVYFTLNKVMKGQPSDPQAPHTQAH